MASESWNNGIEHYRIFFFFWPCGAAWEPSSSTRDGWHVPPAPRPHTQRKRGVLTTGLPGKSRHRAFFKALLLKLFVDSIYVTRETIIFILKYFLTSKNASLNLKN